MNGKTVFVASTLPARFLLDNSQKLNVSRLICGSEFLKLSYAFLKEKFINIEIVSVPSVREEREKFLLREVENSKNGIIIFHECCWRELDLAILKVQPVVEYYPCVTLDSWKKLSVEELGFFKLFFKFIAERNKSILKLIYFSLRYKKNFDFFEVVEDNGLKNKSYQTVLKEQKVRHLKKCDECLKSRKCSKVSAPDDSSKNIILVVATDVVENKWQEQVFEEVADLCKKNGYNILVKDHPNPHFRLNLKDTGRAISPYLPFEVIEESYFVKIGLFSTTLAFEPEKSISIAELFHPVSADLKDREKHLLSIPGGDKIRFVKDIAELRGVIANRKSLP